MHFLCVYAVSSSDIYFNLITKKKKNILTNKLSKICLILFYVTRDKCVCVRICACSCVSGLFVHKITHLFSLHLFFFLKKNIFYYCSFTITLLIIFFLSNGEKKVLNKKRLKNLFKFNF